MLALNLRYKVHEGRLLGHMLIWCVSLQLLVNGCRLWGVGFVLRVIVVLIICG